MKLVKLIWADIFRDGGSYGAELLTDEDLTYSVFLKCSAMTHTKGLQHRWLYEYRGSELPNDCLPIITGSFEEQQIINRLKSFLEAKLKPSDNNQDDSENYHLKRLEELLHYITLREPCFPGDIKAKFSKQF